MKCNNNKCKYYEKGSEDRLGGWFIAKKESGCKFSFCKLKGRKNGNF